MPGENREKSAQVLGFKITRAPRPPREPRVAWAVAGWHPPLAASIVVVVGLIVHEVAYHLTGGTEYPLQLFANGSRVFEISHGGLDAFGVGVLVVGLLWIIDLARSRARRPA